MFTREVCTFALVLKVFYIDVLIVFLLDLTVYIKCN
jgi:hypothetical protein